jgi:sigma-B regulation protein RsbU (phosphoserine phosphatase)
MKSAPAFSLGQALSRRCGTAVRRALALVAGPGREQASKLERDGETSARTVEQPQLPRELAAVNAQLAQELTDHQRTEEALAKRTAELEDARSFLDSVLENLPVMLFVKDAKDLKFVRWNRAEELALGIDRSAAIGRSDYDFFPEEQASFFVAKDRAVLDGGQMVEIPEEAIQTAHRGLRFLHTFKVPVLGADGTPKYLVGISEDITDRKRAQEELARAREQEVEIGFKIQQTLLLDQPPRDVPGVRVAALTIPSQRIDGDFYDFFKHRDDCLDIIVGDVMGKGIPAALLGAATKSHFLQALSRLISLAAPGTLPEPKDIVTLAHSEVARQLIELESFVTVCYARFDLQNNRVDFVDCGHTTTIHFQARTGTCAMLQGENLPLGVSEKEIYEQTRVALHTGDVLLFYSDGLTETRNSAGELFGIERLAECVRTHGRLEPEQLIDQIRQAAVAFSNSETFGDDLTCVAVKIEERELPLARAELEISSDLNELGRARAFVRDVCRTLPGPALDEESVSQLELAITEAASNVMRHAYRGRPEQLIQLDAEVFADRIVLRLHHLGETFDPGAVKTPAFDGTQDGGFGMYIIEQSVDDVQYYRDERGRNCIALVKNCKTV